MDRVLQHRGGSQTLDQPPRLPTIFFPSHWGSLDSRIDMRYSGIWHNGQLTLSIAINQNCTDKEGAVECIDMRVTEDIMDLFTMQRCIDAKVPELTKHWSDLKFRVLCLDLFSRGLHSFINLWKMHPNQAIDPAAVESLSVSYLTYKDIRENLTLLDKEQN